MKIILDVTVPGKIVIGAVAKGRTSLESFSSPQRKPAAILRALDVFFRDHKIHPRRVHAWVVVTGPGHFSQLRVAATVANLYSVFGGRGALLGVTQSRFSAAEARMYVADLLRRCRAVPALRPHYGRPPSITQPKRRW